MFYQAFILQIIVVRAAPCARNRGAACDVMNHVLSEVVFNWQRRTRFRCVVLHLRYFKRSWRDKNVSFYKIPKMNIIKMEETRILLSEKRINVFVAGISKRDMY